MSRTIEALRLIEKAKPKSFRQFGELFWPNNLMHTRITRCGYGVRQGAGSFLCAGSFLGRLRRKGLIIVHRWKGVTEPIATLTDKGYKLLGLSPNVQKKHLESL